MRREMFLPFAISTGVASPANFQDSSRLIRQQFQHLLSNKVLAFQLREKSIEDSRLFELAEQLRSLANQDSYIVINERFDIALAANLDGVHLPSSGIPTSVVRAAIGMDLILGRSVHTLEELAEAKSGDADYVFVSPVFPTISKESMLTPIGIDGLRKFCYKAGNLPVFALGGVTLENLDSLQKAGAAGYAGISMFCI